MLKRKLVSFMVILALVFTMIPASFASANEDKNLTVTVNHQK